MSLARLLCSAFIISLHRKEGRMLSYILIGLGGLITVQVIVQQICTRIDKKKFAAPGEMVTIPGGEMHVCRAGSGEPPVILEAGIAASSINWRPLQAELARVTATYSYDRAGFGWSVTDKPGCTLARISDDLHAMLHTAQVSVPYILVGHSFAGYITRAYANRFPHELAGVVLLDPITPEEWAHPTSSQRWRLRGGVWFSRVGAVLAALGVVRFCVWLLQRGNRVAPKGVLALFGPAALQTVGRILSELTKLPPDALRVIRARWSTPKFFWSMAAYIKSLPECARELEGCSFPEQIPVTVVSGAHQAQLRLQEHAAIAAHSLYGKHIIAENSRHWIHLDQPELVVAAVGEMLSLARSGTLVRHD
jgi:pimeloyl-ACP methyl ester carboxylesterase